MIACLSISPAARWIRTAVFFARERFARLRLATDATRNREFSHAVRQSSQRCNRVCGTRLCRCDRAGRDLTPHAQVRNPPLSRTFPAAAGFFYVARHDTILSRDETISRNRRKPPETRPPYRSHPTRRQTAHSQGDQPETDHVQHHLQDRTPRRRRCCRR